MSTLDEIRPREKNRIMDLVSAAGVDVSDWGNYKKGEKNAASNPKYCYEWSFVQPKKVVVLNLWHSSLEEKAGRIIYNLNIRESWREYSQPPKKPAWAKRALKMDQAIQEAFTDNLPIRVAVCDGKRRRDHGGTQSASHVKKRLLDPIVWAVTAYDWESGQCTLTRGAQTEKFVDQFSIQQELEKPIERRAVLTEVFPRSPEIRRRVLLRANGICEWCSKPGFAMASGKVYLETHHVIPLAEDGADTEANVAALCPNHHREAHYGVIGDEMRTTLLDRVLEKLSQVNPEKTRLPKHKGR